MEWIGWTLVVLLFAVGMAGAIFPILPGVLAIYGAFFVYGAFISFSPFGWWFWILQTSLVAAVIIADYLLGALGVNKFGGSRASVIGSTIGIIIGPFVIPGFGLIVGPFGGAVIGEMMHGSDWRQAMRAGLGAVVGFLTSTLAKILIQLAMIAMFIVWVVMN